MKALVTGASSGIGRDIAEKLSDLGYDIILVGRNNERLQKTADSLKTKSYIISSDLSDRNACLELYQNVQGIAKEDDLEIVINNAGFGLFGEFNNTNINTELNMIDTNIAALHILTKLFLNYFIKKDRGYILKWPLRCFHAGAADGNLLLNKSICAKTYPSYSYGTQAEQFKCLHWRVMPRSGKHKFQQHRRSKICY